MEKREEKNGGENPNNTNGDHTHNTSLLGNNESDARGVNVQAKENGTADVTNGKTDDNQNKDTNQEVQMSNNQTPAATDTSIIPSEQTGNTDTSRSKGTGSSSDAKKSIDETQAGTDTSIIPSEKTGNTKASRSEGTGSSSEVKKSNDESPAATDTSVTTSEKTGNTNPLKSEGTGSSSVNELMKEPPASEDDNGASQPEGGEEFHDAVDITSDKKDVLSSKNAITVQPNNPGDDRAPPPESKQSGSKNLQSEGGSSAPEGKCEEETEAQKRAAKGRSNEEKDMKTGTRANKDDANEARPKEKKANGEGVKGEGGTEDAMKTEERVVKERPVSISLCTSAYSSNVEGLVSYLKGLMKQHPQLIKEVKVHELPYNDLDHYKFDYKCPVDVMILCHSINNRRFAITDVMDALYDAYLPYCARVIGKEKMGVIVHDFDDMRETVQSSRMSSFKYKQPKAFETTSLQITCGHIEKEEQVLKQMLKADRDKIVGFLEHASEYPEEMQKEENKWTESFMSFISKMPSFGFGSSGGANESNIPTPKPEQKNDGTSVDPQPESTVGGDSKPDPPRGTSPVTQQIPGAVHATAASGTEGAIDLPSQQNMTQISGGVFASASSYATPRRISVSVCSSAYKRNVKGLLSWFAKFQAEQSHMITDVRFRQLPYNDIDSFKFPPNDPVDVMVLCHSVDNRGFSITNVENAIYEKYLKYCNKLIGKKKLAVIVHDFADCKPAILESRMESFRRMQKLTFELVDTVIICGSLEESDKLGIRKDDETRLIHFLEFARFEQKENLKQSLLGKLF